MSLPLTERKKGKASPPYEKLLRTFPPYRGGEGGGVSSHSYQTYITFSRGNLRGPEEAKQFSRWSDPAKKRRRGNTMAGFIERERARL